MTRIEVETVDEGDPLRFRVNVHEGDGRSQHTVTVERDVYQRLAGGDTTPEALVEASFQFLLDREPKESILSSFDLTVINRYFPAFEDELPGYL